MLIVPPSGGTNRKSLGGATVGAVPTLVSQPVFSGGDLEGEESSKLKEVFVNQPRGL